MRDNGGIIIDSVDFSTVKNLGIKWSFDKFGNPIPDATECELFKTYKVDDVLYFDIFGIILNQDDILEDTIGYMFDVYQINKFESHGSVANRIVFTSHNDCLDAALIWIKENEELLNDYFKYEFESEQFHPKAGDGEFRIGEYYFSADESNIFDDSKIFIKHKHSIQKN